MEKEIIDLEKYTLREMFILISKTIIYDLADISNLERYFNHCLFLFDHVLDDGEEKEYHHLLAVIEKKKKSLDKKDPKRNSLNHIKRCLKNQKEIYQKEEYQDNPFADIILYWLKDENCYDYIKNLLRRKKECYNIHINGKHIIFSILNEYIHNFELLLTNKNGQFISKDYIREVYFLFTKSYYLKLSKEEKQEIDDLLKNFIKYVETIIIKNKRKNISIREIKTLKTSYFYKKVNILDEYIDDDAVLFEIERILKYNQNNKKDTKISPVFISGNYIYKLSDNKLTMYSLNLALYAQNRSIFSRYLEELELSHETMEQFYQRKFIPKLENSYEAIGYTFSFDESGNVIDFKMEEEVIFIDKIYHTLDGKEIDELYLLYQKLAKKNHLSNITDFDLFKINEFFNDLFNKVYFKYVEEHRLPIINYGYNLIDEETFMLIKKDFAYLLGNLSKHDAYIVLEIINQKGNNSFYSMYYDENMLLDMHLLENTNYLALLNQRMNNIILKKDLFDEEHYQRFIDEIGYNFMTLTQTLNEFNDSIDLIELKKNKGRLIQKKPWK